MTERPRHIDQPDAADAADAGLRGGLDFIAMAEAALAHGGPAARRGATRALGWIDGTEPDPAVAMKMTGSGRNHPRQVLRQIRREADLRGLRRSSYPDLGRTAAADAIAADWHRYASDVWPRHEAAGVIPAADPEATFARLMANGNEPLAAETLRKVLSKNGRFAPVELTRFFADLCLERRSTDET